MSIEHPGPQFRTVVQASLIAVGLFCVAVYVLFQARFLLIGPQLWLVEEPDFRQSDRIVILHGSASNISRLWLNGRPVFTDPAGDFAVPVVLENGLTHTTLEAADRYNRRVVLERRFLYTPATAH